MVIASDNALAKELNLFDLVSDPCDADPCPSGQICAYSSTMVQGNHYTCTGNFFSFYVNTES